MGEIWNIFVGFLEYILLQFAVFTGNAGIGILLFTICARLVILPLTLTSIRSSRELQKLQPMIKELQRKYGKDAQKLQEETLKLYREHKVNPAGGCLPMLLQLPIFFGVYQAVYHLMIPDNHINLSAAVKEAISHAEIAALFLKPFLGLDLGVAAFGKSITEFYGVPYLILPILSVALQMTQQLMATPRVQDPQQKAMMQSMMFMPLIFGYIAFIFPTGAVLYWVTSSLVGIVQQYFTSGWGSLANYLTFLPPDRSTKAAQSAVIPAATGEVVVPEPPAVRAGFWDVLRPLTEAEGPTSAAAVTDAATDESIEAARRQSEPNAQRMRRRK